MNSEQKKAIADALSSLSNALRSQSMKDTKEWVAFAIEDISSALRD